MFNGSAMYEMGVLAETVNLVRRIVNVYLRDILEEVELSDDIAVLKLMVKGR